MITTSADLETLEVSISITVDTNSFSVFRGPFPALTDYGLTARWALLETPIRSVASVHQPPRELYLRASTRVEEGGRFEQAEGNRAVERRWLMVPKGKLRCRWEWEVRSFLLLRISDVRSHLRDGW